MPKGCEYLGEIRDRETFARGGGIRDLQRLKDSYGDGDWRKCKGRARIEVRGRAVDAEVHWYEAHGIGRVEDKIKRIFK